MEFGTVTMDITEVAESEVVAPLKQIVRIANDKDHRPVSYTHLDVYKRQG